MKQICRIGVFFSIIIVLFLNITATALGATYYVATNGNDANPGTLSQPWRTLQKAAQTAVGGDTVNIRGGTYNGYVALSKTGAENARIIFQSYPGEMANLVGGSLSNDGLYITGQYYDIKNMTIGANGLTRIGINLSEAKHVRITNCIIRDCDWGAVYTQWATDDILFDNNTVFNNVLKNKNRDISGAVGWPSAVSMGGTNFTVTNCLIYENYGEGIGFYGQYQYAAYNTLHDNYSVNIYVDNVRDSTVERNFVYSLDNPAFFRTLYNRTAGAVGIQVANESVSDPNKTENLKIINNIVKGALFSFMYYSGGGGWVGMKNCLVANNVFYRGISSVLHLDGASGHSNNTFVNNIFYQTGAMDIAYNYEIPNPLTGFSFYNNCWYAEGDDPEESGSYPARLAGAGDINANPLLVNPGGNTPGDYKLTAGSPLINTGVYLAAVPIDYFGAGRPVGPAYDIGAHEFGGIPATPTPSPTPTLTPSPTLSPGITVTPTATPSASIMVTPTATPNGDNLAQNKPATADSTEWWSTPSQGNDGNASTRWSAADNGSHWWKVDLGASCALSGTEVIFADGGSVYKYKIEVSTDDTHWTMTVDMTGNAQAMQTHIVSFNATARYVRITSVSGSDWLTFWEFRVMPGSVLVTPTPTAIASPSPTPTSSGVLVTPTATATPSPGTNLAVNKTASADVTMYSGSPSYANDGINSTQWDSGDNSFPHWWKVDLGASYNISRTEVMWTETNSAYKYKIEVSGDNSNWTVKVDKTNNTTRTQTNVDSFTATARYVRITVNGSSDWYAGAKINEFRVY